MFNRPSARLLRPVYSDFRLSASHTAPASSPVPPRERGRRGIPLVSPNQASAAIRLAGRESGGTGARRERGTGDRGAAEALLFART
jgi:hypothetical protein